MMLEKICKEDEGNECESLKISTTILTYKKKRKHSRENFSIISFESNYTMMCFKVKL